MGLSRPGIQNHASVGVNFITHFIIKQTCIEIETLKIIPSVKGGSNFRSLNPSMHYVVVINQTCPNHNL